MMTVTVTPDRRHQASENSLPRRLPSVKNVSVAGLRYYGTVHGHTPQLGSAPLGASGVGAARTQLRPAPLHGLRDARSERDPEVDKAHCGSPQLGCGGRVRGMCPFAVRGCEGLGSPGVIPECLSRRVGRGSECSVVASITYTHEPRQIPTVNKKLVRVRCLNGRPYAHSALAPPRLVLRR